MSPIPHRPSYKIVVRHAILRQYAYMYIVKLTYCYADMSVWDMDCSSDETSVFIIEVRTLQDNTEIFLIPLFLYFNM